MLLQLAFAALLAQAAPHPTPEENALMDRIERDVRLPGDVQAPGRFHRTYAWLGDHTVVAIYESVSEGAPARRWVEPNELPIINDGGCSIITVFFNPRTEKLDTMCNPDPFANMHR